MSKYVSSQPSIQPVSLGKNYLHWLNLRVHIFYIKILIVFYLKYKYKYLNAIFLINKKRDFKLVFANDSLQTHTVMWIKFTAFKQEEASITTLIFLFLTRNSLGLTDHSHQLDRGLVRVNFQSLDISSPATFKHLCPPTLPFSNRWSIIWIY